MGIGLLSRCVMEGIHVLFLSCLTNICLNDRGGRGKNSRKNFVLRAARTLFFFNNIIFKILCGNDDCGKKVREGKKTRSVSSYGRKIRTITTDEHK